MWCCCCCCHSTKHTHTFMYKHSHTQAQLNGYSFAASLHNWQTTLNINVFMQLHSEMFIRAYYAWEIIMKQTIIVISLCVCILYWMLFMSVCFFPLSQPSFRVRCRQKIEKQNHLLCIHCATCDLIIMIIVIGQNVKYRISIVAIQQPHNWQCQTLPGE